MSRRNWPEVSVDFDPIPASSLCQVVTGNQASAACDEFCDCRHLTFKSVPRRSSAEVMRWTETKWNISVDPFSGTAVTYAPVYDPEVGHELITEPELAELL